MIFLAELAFKSDRLLVKCQCIIGNDKNAGKYHLNFFNGKLRSLKIRHNAEP